MNPILTVVGTVAGVAVAGAAAFVGYRALVQSKAIGDLQAAGSDSAQLDILSRQWRETAGGRQTTETGGLAVGANETAADVATRVLSSAQQYMSAWREAGVSVPSSLRAVPPLDKRANWKIGEGAWLPGEPGTSTWRQEPVAQLRGFDVGFAMTYLPDVYGATSDGTAVVVVRSNTPWQNKKWDFPNYRTGRKFPTVINGRFRPLDVFISSTAQGSGGFMAVWDAHERRFLRRSEFLIMLRPPGVRGRDTWVFAGNQDMYVTASDYGADLFKALGKKPAVIPFDLAGRRS